MSVVFKEVRDKSDEVKYNVGYNTPEVPPECTNCNPINTPCDDRGCCKHIPCLFFKGQDTGTCMPVPPGYVVKTLP
ncbi:hypothetical protein Btru_045474 [Bulinus truncatus]|nr:hypothetical protein Btru_045474 [Bulinus truncatus]